MKRKLKKLTALLLSILMATSSLTELLPAARAEGGGGSIPAAETEQRNMDASSPDTGKPGLYVDFLGDNNAYRANKGESPNLNGLLTPGDVDQSYKTNPDLTEAPGIWGGYQSGDVQAGTIFWVGVGVDRMNVLDLFRQSDSGIYSLELGFYYNSDFIAPYTGTDYKTVIKDANITNYNHKWGAEYEIISAVTDLPTQTDLVTQETLKDPAMDEILGTDLAEGTENPWKMTYIALEKKADSVEDNRFAGPLYDGEFHPVNDEDTKSNQPTKYLLLIPFVLKAHDPAEELCLRLVRNASHFSIGGGPDGADPYAAWERVTVRNNNRELKLMANFRGDLNIFTGERAPDAPYDASLVVETAGGVGNAAELTITNDPSPIPVKADTNGQSIKGLHGGIGMTLEVVCQSGYDVKVTVTQKDKVTPVPFTVVKEKEHYTFIMPEDSVIVTVQFGLNGDTDFWTYLQEDRSKEDPVDTTAGGKGVQENDTVITVNDTAKTVIDKDSPADNPGKLPGGKVEADSVITVQTKTHADYYAVVELYSEANIANVPPDTIDPAGIAADENNRVVLPAGGTLTLKMPKSDIVVKVQYVPAQRQKATLEIYHDVTQPTPVLPDNAAQLSAAVYTDENTPMPGYSGVVYHRYDGESDPVVNDHSAVERTFRVLEKVDASSAFGSGSLGGDGGKTAVGWSDSAQSFMALAYSAAKEEDLKGKFSPFDLKGVALPGKDAGLRKNAAGDYYTDSKMDEFAARLYELAQLAKAAGTYQVEVKDTAGADPNKVLYSYYNLTSAQVQVYLLDYEKYAAKLEAGVTPAPTAPVLRTADAAATELAGYTWFKPSTDTLPPTAPDLTKPAPAGTYLETRAGRQVDLVLAADAAYTVQSIVLHDPRSESDPANAQPDVEVKTRPADYQNVYTFTMPDYDCAVRVTYGLRERYDLGLSVSGADGKTENKFSLTAYTPGGGSAATPVSLTGAGTINGVLGGSVVSVTVNKYTGYKVSASVTRTGDSSAVITTPASTADMKNGAVFTFVMPEGNANVAIAYTKENVPARKATILTDDLDTASGSVAVWKDTTQTVLPSVQAGTALQAVATVRPGFYIHSVEVYSSTRSYAYEMSGNGWNNGRGGTATVDTVMPGEDLYVRFVFNEGPPPEEPALPLAIRVDDPENTGEGDPLVFADNYAQAAYGTTTLGPVGKGATGGRVLTASDYAAAGDEVVVEFHPEAGYHVSSAEVVPASLGTTLEWLSPTRAKFIMPAGSATIAVAFAKGTAKTWFMDLAKTENEAGSEENTVDKFDSDTIQKVPLAEGYPVPQPLPQRVPTDPNAYGAATAGETVTLSLSVAAGWHIHSLTVTSGGTRLPYQLPDGQGYHVSEDSTVRGTFVMPNSDVSVTVNYRKGEPSPIRDYQVELAVTDPDNVNDGTVDWTLADNHASAVISGSTTGTIGPVGLTRDAMRGAAYAKAGDTVTIDYAAGTGFALDIIIVTPTGLKIVPTYLGGGKASFVMPAESVTAEVRFKKGAASQYTADLILRMPAGTALADYDKVGEGTFGGDLTNKLYSKTAAAGETVDLSLLAKDGYYIRKVGITPAALGVEAVLSGAFGRQDSAFVMPAANVTVNVWFEKLWPDQVKYDLALEVFDGDRSGSAARFERIADKNLDSPNSDPVTGGDEVKILAQAAHDKDSVFVALEPAAGYYAKEIFVTDGRGVAVSWGYAPGGIQFTMPPSRANVSIRFEKGTPPTYEAALHVTRQNAAVGTVKLSDGAITVDGATETTITGIPVGKTLTVSTEPTTGIVTSAYAVNRATGEQLIVPMSQVTAGGENQFAMPDADADVYITLDNAAVQPDDLAATLQVSGPAGAGSAAMNAATAPAVGTGAVSVGASGLLFAPKDTLITVDLTVHTGFNLASVRVSDGTGKDVDYLWADAGQRKLTFTMPAAGAAVHVALEGITDLPDYTAQVVVNDLEYTGAAASENTALLRKDGATAGTKLVTPLKAGDLVHLDLTVQPGFEVKAVLVVPAKYGIAPSLLLKPNKDQSASFTMPADDVVVYVRFGSDNRVRQPVTLIVEGTPGVTENHAFIATNYSGKKGPVVSGGRATVQAAPPSGKEPAEWVTVDYAWQTGQSVKSVTILADGTPVPFTQVNDKQIIFPMIDAAVTVTITYADEPQPPQFDAVLHVIDLDDPAASADSWGKLTWDGTSVQVNAYSAKDDEIEKKILKVPAGETVTLDAVAGTDTYIQAAYVLYVEGGQMIDFLSNSAAPGDKGFTPDAGTPGYTGAKQASFRMHPGQNDVYVYVTKTAPSVTEYASVLFLDGPAADTASTAKMTHSGGPSSAVVAVNGPHGYVTAEKGETVTVTVLPNAGYTIDYILMTPLGIADIHGGKLSYTRTGNTFTFPMPEENVAVRVVLKESSDAEYKATLHYGRPNDGILPSADWASLSYQSEDGSTVTWDTNGAFKVVPEGTTVTLKASMDAPDLILAAYVLKGSVLVPLSKALEGVEEGASALDDTLPDAEATFTMPGGDVDVYVWFTKAKPMEHWRTAVLTVTDDDGKGIVNSGKNSATLESSESNMTPKTAISQGVSSHAFIPVEEGETVTVKVTSPAPGYEFQRPATVTHSPAGTLGLTESGSSPDYRYTFNVGAFNSAVAVHYKGTTVNQNDLTVVAVDDDNPGDETVTNTVTVNPGAMTPLVLESKTSAGAKQVVRNVKEGTTVSTVVKPQNDTYLVSAMLVLSDGTEKTVALTKQEDGSYVAAPFSMPNRPATLKVTFYRSYSAKLSLVNAPGVADQSSTARMTESSAGKTVTANVAADGFFASLPGGTQLTASMADQAEGTRLAGAILVVNDTATILGKTIPTEGPDEYRHVIANADAEIQMVVADKNDTKSYLAAVSAKGLPDGCAAPAIHTTPTANAAEGKGWTVAEEGETVSVSVTAPAGYRADLSAAGVTLSTTSVGGTDDEASDSVTFIMPPANVQVTVTYVKTAFNATLAVRDETGGSATLTANSTTLNNSGSITGLTEGASLAYTATAVEGYALTGVLLTTAGGVSEYLPATDPGDIKMPADDVTITAVFGNTPVAPEDKLLYTAAVSTVGTDSLPGNAAQRITNTTTAGLPAGTLWAGGYEKDGMLVAFTTRPGYTAVVKAEDANGSVPVLQQDLGGGAGTAALVMRDSNVLVTITYYGPDDPKPTLDKHDLTLTLVGHGKEEENRATLSDEEGKELLTLKGADAADADTPATKTLPTAASLGVNLDLSADRKSDYTIVKATVEIEGVITELNLNRYGTNATSLFFMPDADATVTVYYKKVYNATLQIAGAEAGDKVSMTDDRDGTTPVTESGGQLTRLVGEEQITTTAVPDTGRELVGVIYATNTTGAHTVSANRDTAEDDDYLFKMPTEDVSVTAVFQKAGNGYHIAKVALDPDGDGNGVAGNSVAIANKGDPKAPGGPFWTAAKNGAGVTVTIGLAEGYQAEITSAKTDPKPDGTEGTDIYINRIYFTAGTADKTAAFTMPDDDVTVTVKFIKGYSAALEITDVSQLSQESTSTITAGTAITGTSDGGNPPTITYTDDNTPPNTVNKISGLDGAAQIEYEVTPGTGVVAKVVKTTAATGTQGLDPAPGSFNLANENATVGVILRDENDPNGLLAKVQVLGESDIVGNTAEIVDKTPELPNGTASGNIWTTTKADNTVTVTLRVAKGYVAAVKAERDDTHAAILLTGGGETKEQLGFSFVNDTGGDPNISDPQELTFKMPADTDATVFIEYTYAGTIPAPHDPERPKAGTDDGLKLEKGFIYGVNRGDCAVITIPTLADSNQKLYNADRYDTDPLTAVSFRFFLKEGEAYTELEDGVDMTLAPYDPLSLVKPDDSYNYGEYYTQEADGTNPAKAYTGARFTISPKGTGTNAEKLNKILNNKGSLVDVLVDGVLVDNGDTSLYVMAENGRAETSAYTQVLVRSYYELKGTFLSYAPTHEATVSLYAGIKGETTGAMAGDPAKPESYETEAFAVDKVAEETGSGLWRQEFSLKSSELLGGTYMLVVEKTSHITYTRVNLELVTANLDTPDSKSFTISDVISLIPGDVVAGGKINLRDQERVTDYLEGGLSDSWTEETDETEPGWQDSIYNPETEAYRCDLDGNGRITTADRAIVMDYMGWSSKDYEVGGKLPSGLSTVAAFLLMESADEELPPEGEAADPEVPTDPETPPPPVDPEKPVGPDGPIEPEAPVEPEIPVLPEEPTDPAPPAELETPVDPAPPEDQQEPPKPETGDDPPPAQEGDGTVS